MPVRRVSLLLAAACAGWVLLLSITSGVTLWLGSVQVISSRNPRNPGILALLLLMAWAAGARRDGLRNALAADLGAAGTWLGRVGRQIRRGGAHGAVAATSLGRWLDRLLSALPAWIAALATVGAVIVATVEGAFVVGGADSWGYVSQAHLWAEGRLVVEEPLLRELEGITSKEASAPLGYHLTPDAGAIVPSYPPGFPLLMAAFELAGGREAVFAVVPVFSGVLVAATFLLGRVLAGSAVGAAAAVLMATSPAFLFNATAPPMSDIPAAALWTLALALVPYATVAGAAGSGLAAGAAILTRPNLVPLAVIPLAVLAWPLIRQRRADRRRALRVLVYLLGTGAACVTFGAVNLVLNGSPLTTGYGTLAGYYDWSNWAHNLSRYTTWVVESQTLLIALALAAPYLLRARPAAAGTDATPRAMAGACALFAAGVLASYLFYLRFEAWMFVRFLLPAFPVLLIFMCAVLLGALGRLPRGLAALAGALAIVVLAWHGWNDAWARGTFTSETERKYALVGRYIDRRLPPRAAVITTQHSGSVRYYSGRATVRWDLMDPIRLDDTVARLRERGYEPYILVEQTELAEFRARFSAHTELGRLDWRPVAHLPLGDIRLFAASRVNEPRSTEAIPDP